MLMRKLQCSFFPIGNITKLNIFNLKVKDIFIFKSKMVTDGPERQPYMEII